MTAIGVDLGTTNSVIAYIDEHLKPVVIPNQLGETITPSVICFKEGEIIVGAEAKELQALGMYPIAAFFKRQMGDELFIFEADGVDYTATELATILLRKIKQDAEAFLGKPITDAVITVPAYFRNKERNATIEAGKAAGINVLQVINEPTAAAVVYGLGKTDVSQNILVYDLGGGTFDVTLLRLEKDVIRVKNSDGDHQLGGKDWDDRIIEYVATSFQSEFGTDPLEDAETMADLLILAEETKKRLTSFEKTKIAISHDGEKGRYELDRDTFNRITSDLMQRTMSMTLRVLEDMKMQPKDIDGVLLIGGSTRMPMVHDFIRTQITQRLLTGVNVDEAVAMGAALVAAEKLNESKSIPMFAIGGKTKTIDVTNHSLGMIAINQDQSAYINSLILPKNVEIPCKDSRPFQHRTSSRINNELEIYMTQGESEVPADVSYIGRYVVTGIPHQKGGQTVIDVGYSYDVSGTVKVDAKDRSSGKELTVTVEKLPMDVPQRFAGIPDLSVAIPEHVTVYLAFDLSGSMSGEPLIKAKNAAHEFLKNCDLSHCSIGIIACANRVLTKLDATQNGKKITAAINALSVGDEVGYGNSAHPFDEIFKQVNDIDGRRFGIVLADGMWSYQDKAIEQAKRCHDANIDIIAIGFGSADKQFLNEIASSDEDSFFTSMDGLVETFSTIAQVITESGGLSMIDSKDNKSGSGLFSRSKIKL